MSWLWQLASKLTSSLFGSSQATGALAPRREQLTPPVSERFNAGVGVSTADADGPTQKLYEGFFQFGFVFMASWCQDKSRAALEESIRLLRISIALCPPNAPDRDFMLFTLGFVYHERYKICGSLGDLQNSIAHHREAVEVCPEGNSIRSELMNNLSNTINDRYARLGDIDDLKECIRLHREALELRPDGHPDRSATLNNLANALTDQYERLGNIADLYDSIHLHRETLELRPEGHPDRSDSLNNLAVSLINRYAREGDIDDLKDCIRMHQEALALRPKGHPNRPSSLNNLANALRAQYDLLGDLEDLEARIRLHREALSFHPEEHPNRHMSLNNLANALSARYSRLGDIADLMECIKLHREGLKLCPGNHPNRPTFLDNLANALSDRAARFGDVTDHDECMELHKEALSLRPEGHPHRSMSLNNLANAFSRRYERTGNIKDLEEQIRLHQEALKLRPDGHPDRPLSLNNLAVSLSNRYARFGGIADLEENISLHQEALSLHPEGHPDRPASLNNLAVALRNRYERLGDITDLEEHIRLYQEALSLHPEGHPKHAGSLSNLAIALGDRFTRLGDVANLHEHIRLHEEALALRPEGHPDRSGSLNNLALALSKRYEHLGDVSDLEKYVRILREALQLRPKGHPHYSGFLGNLGTALSKQYACFGHVEDLEECIRVHKEALALCPEGHPDRSMSLVNLANALSKRYERFRNIMDLREAIAHLRSGSTEAGTFSSPAVALHCAFRWKEVAEAHQHNSLGEAFTTVVANIRRYIAIGPTTQLQYATLLRDREISTLPSEAAAYFIENGKVEDAIELLDEGRALLSSEMRRFREALTAEEKARIGEELSTRYLELCKDLRDLSNAEVRFETFSKSSVAASKPAGESDSQSNVAYGELLKEKRLKMEAHANVLQRIRQRPGCEDFQRSSKFAKLRQAAHGGPIVIINCSEPRSDVIILFSHRAPLLIPLDSQFHQTMGDTYDGFLEQMTALGNKRDVTSTISGFLAPIAKQLWNKLVRQVVEALQDNGIERGSRIWWCPTSFLTSLPIHAAGNGSEWLIDYYVSSYTPTLSALISTRQTGIQESSSPPRILVTAQTMSSGLKNAAMELKEMQALPTFRESLDEECATPRSVATHLPLHNWAHFICHGTVADNPFESYLHLFGGSKLTLNDIIKLHMTDAKFAFLAACHSAAQSRDAKALTDEVLHLAAAMQISGFRSVVGTMWQMEDEDGPRMARKFYAEIFNGECAKDGRHTLAATALWKAVRWLKDESMTEKREKKQKKERADGGEATVATKGKAKKAKKKKEEMPIARWANYIHIGA